MLAVLVTVLIIGTATSEYVGYTNSEKWAYQWYPDEPFHMYCNMSGLNTQASEYVIWHTPDKQILQNDHNDDNYQVSEMSGVRAFELHIKKIKPELQGVYICKVYNGNTAMLRNQTIFGLNVHDVKYHDMFDKYRYNLVVAVIATATFLIPLVTICFVYQFQYRTDDEKKRIYSPNDHEMQEDNGLAASVKSPEGRGAYENLEHFTQL